MGESKTNIYLTNTLYQNEYSASEYILMIREAEQIFCKAGKKHITFCLLYTWNLQP